MCQWCISTLISRHLTSELSSDRRQFLKFSSALLAAGSAAYSIPGMAQASGPADVIFAMVLFTPSRAIIRRWKRSPLPAEKSSA